MRFRVIFTEPMVYQADHPVARRVVTELVVSSDTARRAEMHALRTVSGSGDVLRVEPVDGPFGHPPAVENIDDVDVLIRLHG
jgi:hypothetical protein